MLFSKCDKNFLLSQKTLTVLLFLSTFILFLFLSEIYSRFKEEWSYAVASSSSVDEVDLLDNYPLKKPGKVSKYKFNEDFYPVNQRGIYSFTNVCVEAIPGDPLVKQRQLPDRIVTYNETQRIVVYDSFFRSGQQTLQTSASVNAFALRWDIFFSHDSVPATHKWLPDAAFFISQSCPGNFHHFWSDEFLMLYSVMNVSNRLAPSLKNHVLYRTPWDLAPDELACDDIHRYEQFLKYLHVEFPHEVFYKMPVNTCFQYGVFGLVNLNYDSKRTVQYVIQAAGIKQTQCLNPQRVLIIQRNLRKILNVNDLLEAAKAEGYPESEVIILENLSVEEQLKLVACSPVMVGVQGAGLQWSIFMPQGSTLIEIAWPQKHWGFYFTSWVTAYGIDHQRLVTQHVHVNWPVYEAMVRKGEEVTSEEREKLLKSEPKNTFDNVFKWADVFVDQKDFIEVLQTTKEPTSQQ